jgi:murein L,D-transpeptidase YafK
MKRSLLALGVALIIFVLAWANWPEPSLPPNTVADRLVVEKSRRQLHLYSNGQRLKTYRVSLGHHPVGKKEREGDGRTPEGQYVIDYRKEQTCCYRSLHISYPDASDRARAAASQVNPGGLIMVHGLSRGLGWVGRFHRLNDWTDGCVAVTNREMAELWRSVPAGTPIELRP